MSQHPTRIPADVDRPDRVLGPLTLRQVTLLGTAGIALYGLYMLTRAVLPLPVFAVLALPLGIVATVVALGHRHGVPLDQLLLAALRQQLSPRHRVAAPEGVRPAPAWLAATHPEEVTGRRPGARTARGGGAPVSPAPLHLPAQGVADTGAQAGVVDLGTDGLAVLAACSTVNFSLRTTSEQEALVASFARYLHSLTAPVQILVRAERLDLHPQIAELHARAGGLPHPALEAAARDHADYLTDLTAQSDLLRRQVLLVLREPLHTAPAPGAAFRRLPWRGPQSDGAAPDEGARQAAEQRLVRRLGEATELLSPAGIVLTPLEAAAATGVLASACNPDTFLPPSAGLAAEDEVVTSTTTFTDLYGPDTPPPAPTAAHNGRDREHEPAAPQAAEEPGASPQSPAGASRSGPWLSDDDDFDYDDELESR